MPDWTCFAGQILGSFFPSTFNFKIVLFDDKNGDDKFFNRMNINIGSVIHKKRIFGQPDSFASLHEG